MKRTFDYCNSGNKKEKIFRNVDHDYINYISVPTLKSIATVRVVTSLNIPPDIRNAIRRDFSTFMYIGQEDFRIDPDRNKIFAEIDKIISILPLPTLLKADISSFTRPIELQRLKWMKFFKCTECIDALHWTNEGTIARQKTVEKYVINNSRHCMSKIFKLACNYCFETCIPNIWEKLPESKKKHYLGSKDIYNSYDHHLLAYWIHFTKGNLSELLRKIKRHDWKNIYNCNQSVYRNMFTLGLSQGNIMAVKYFWEKLTYEEKCSNLARWVNDTLENGRIHFQVCGNEIYQETNGYSDLLYFLLSQMTDDKQQREVFQKNSLFILNSLFFYWPWQKFLLPTLQIMWDYLEEKVYINFISLVGKQIKEGYGTEEILRKIWCISPTSFRNCFIQYVLHSGTENSTDLLCDLLLVKDIAAIQMILKDVDVHERKSLIFNLIQNRKLLQLIYTDKLSLFDILVQNTLTSKADVLDLKEIVVRTHGRNVCHQWICDDNLESVKKFFSWAFTSQNQINKFKQEVIDKTEIVHSVVLYQANFELADKFLNWCCCSQKEVNEFKKDFALSTCEIVEIGEDDWHMLEKLVHWCFVSDEDINEFKLGVLQNFHIVDSAISIKYNFEFVNKLINWCCHSEEDIKEYKTRFALSERFMEILQHFVSDSLFDDDLCDFKDFTKKLITLFSPLEERVIIELKEKIRNVLYLSNQEQFCPLIEEKHLFRMIDDVNNISNKNSTDD